jgi:hypothetical protein
MVSRRETLRVTAPVELGFVMIAGIWPLIFFSISSCKLPTYILPAIPMLCLGVGKMLADTVWAREPIAFFRRYSDSAVAFATFLSLLACIVAGVTSSVLGRSNSTDLIAVRHVCRAARVMVHRLSLVRSPTAAAILADCPDGRPAFRRLWIEFCDRRVCRLAFRGQPCGADSAGAERRRTDRLLRPLLGWREVFHRIGAHRAFRAKSNSKNACWFVANQPLAIVVTDIRQLERRFSEVRQSNSTRAVKETEVSRTRKIPLIRKNGLIRKLDSSCQAILAELVDTNRVFSD